MADSKSGIQKLWGIVLVVTGGSMFFAIPQKIRVIQDANEYSVSAVAFLTFSFYLISILLIVGGGKKIYDTFFKKASIEDQSGSDKQ